MLASAIAPRSRPRQNGSAHTNARWPARIAISIAILFVMLLMQPAILVNSVKAADQAPDPNPLATSTMAAHFPQPLVRTGPTTPAEDLALARSLVTYNERREPDDFASLTSFLSAHPKSGWNAALLTNLGILYVHYGYFTRAIDAWHRAWIEGKNANDLQAKALVDGAVGNLARLYSYFGQTAKLSALFKEIGNRPIAGSALEEAQEAGEELSAMEKRPDDLYRCGPLALRSLLLSRGAASQDVSFLQWYHTGPNGTSLAEVARLAEKAKLSYRVILREPGQRVPLPAIVHWKVGHFAAIIGEANGRYHVADPVFPGQSLWVTPKALDTEASGYFLVPSDAPADPGWRQVSAAEAGKVWGKGPTNATRPGGAGALDPLANPPSNCPLCGYNIRESSVSVTLSDTPVGYSPPIGPSAKVTITYNQREDSQPALFTFYNVSPLWTLNWLTYVTDDPLNLNQSPTRYLAGGGAFYYGPYNMATGQLPAQDNDGSILVRVSTMPIVYQRWLQDGSIEVYAQPDNGSAVRNVFLSEVIDPQGNAVTLNYDTSYMGYPRLTSLIDAAGRQTTFTYGLASFPLLITQITDPFNRSATLSYDAYGRLGSITDVLGLTSTFSYDPNSRVNAMQTPYGTTTFAYNPGLPSSSPPRYVQVTDPLGFNEREEWVEDVSSVPYSDPTSPVNTVPTNMPLSPYNEYLNYRDSFHWDKNDYVVAGCTITIGSCNYLDSRDTHFHHEPNTSETKSTSIESIKYPLENRIWFNYPGQTQSQFGGTYDKPVAIGRVLDDQTSQLSSFAYDTTGYFNLTQAIDPLGRATWFFYSNHVDLAAISQTTANGAQTTIAQFIYNAHHRPIFSTDAAGQTTSYTYNASGQLTSVTNPLNQTTTYQYNSTGDLTAIINANNVTAASFTYDAFDRIATYMDSEGWTVSYTYDNADRVTKITYPDGTTDTYTYNILDLASYRDREGRTWTYTHDADRRLTAITDPLGHQTQFGYNNNGQLTSLTDANNNTTSWTYDVEGRLTTKQYPDTSTVTFAYENTTSRLKSVTDALDQTKQYGYAEDNRLSGITYLGAVNPTPNVSFAYDPFFPRLVSITDVGTGTTQYSYVPIGSMGALQLQQESSPLANSAISYAYDALGRLSSRTVTGAGAETFQYDALGRLMTHANDLGSFSLSYLGQTGQITARALASSTLATAWSYLPNSGDRRLAGIDNTGLSSGQYSNYAYTTTPESFISAISETSDSTAVYPSTLQQTASYNNLNQLTNLSGQALSFDADGNLLSDGQRTYSWDAENRLVGIAYPAQPGKATAFAYDGLGRRTAISSTPPGGGSAVTTSYLWCGSAICQARNLSNAVTREYYDEGEYVPGSPAQPYYYGIDQIGSARRIFASATSAPAYRYDPYGNRLQATAPLTDFNYAGMFYNADSGLYLTQYRAYDPVASRWLSRDPMGEGTDPEANLYPYVGGNPVNAFDPTGRQGWVGALIGAAGGAIAGYAECGLKGAVVGGVVGAVVGAAAPALAAGVAGRFVVGRVFAFGVRATVFEGVNAAGGAIAAATANFAANWTGGNVPLSQGVGRGAIIGAVAPIASLEVGLMGVGGPAAIGLPEASAAALSAQTAIFGILGSKFSSR